MSNHHQNSSIQSGGGRNKLTDPIEHKREPLLALGVGEELGRDQIFSVGTRDYGLKLIGDCTAQFGGRRSDVAHNLLPAVDDCNNVLKIMAGDRVGSAPISESR